MGKLDISLKAFNLLFTDTVERDYLRENSCDFNKVEVNHEECISLYDLINVFNKMHKAFKKEYDEMEKMDLGQEIDIQCFTKKENLRLLDVLVYKPKMINEKYTHLYLREINGVSLPFITNDYLMHSDDGYYRSFIRLSAKMAKNYLDLFEKYQLLFDLYNYLKNEIIYNDGTFTLYTRIDSKRYNFLDTMDKFIVRLITNHEIDSGDDINIEVNLRDELETNMTNSKIKLGNEEVIATNETYLDILKSIYVHGKYLEKHKKNETKQSSGNKVKLLINKL